MEGRIHFQATTIKGAAIPNIDNSHLSVFDQNFWLKIVGSTAGYREEVAFKDGVPMARLSYTLIADRFWGIPWGLSPPVSCRNGPVLSQALSDADKPVVLRLLIERTLRRHPLTSFVFICDPHAKDADLIRQEFIRAGFKHTTSMNTVRHPDQPGIMSPQPSDNAAINKRRSHIKNAQGKLDILDDVSPDQFIAFYDSNLGARGKTKNYVDSSLARALIAEGMAHKQARILAARRKKKSPDEPDPLLDAALVIAWDKPIAWDMPPADKCDRGGSDPPKEERCYLLLLTYRLPSPERPHEKPNADANKVLIIEAADFAAKNGLIFDTGGTATEGAEKYYRQLFPYKRSEEFCDVFKRVKWYAGWYEKHKLAFKEAAARHGITQIRLSRHNARIVWRKFVYPLIGPK